MPYRLLTAALVFAVAAPAPAAKPDPVLERLRTDVFYLAGPECAGRGVYGDGINKAADYIAAAFREAGLQPAGPDGSYFQPFTITGSPKLGTPNTLVLTAANDTKTDLAYGTDFTPTGMTKPGKLSAGLAFVGYGITSTKDPKYDDYAGLDVKGKWVLVLRKAPRAGDPHGPFTSEQQSLQNKVVTAKDHGAKGVIFVNPAVDAKDDAVEVGNPAAKPEVDDLMDFGYAAGSSAGIPVLHIKRKFLKLLLMSEGKKLTDIETAIDDDLKPRSLLLKDWTANAVISVDRPKHPAKNVVGVLPGSGPLADETVVIGAHYDHLGTGEYGSLGGKDAKGQVHYGADDNASGTTGLIELARRFGTAENRTGRRLVFIAFSGEEIALLGSRHYADHPLFPLDKTVFMLNMDMIGRVKEVEDEEHPHAKAVAGGAAHHGKTVMRDRIVVYGTGTAEGMDNIVDAAARPFDFKVLKVPGGTGPSDHDSFYRKEVPVLFLFTGTHKDYHRPSDTPDKLNIPGMMKVVGLAETVVRRFADAPKAPGYLVAQGGWSDPTDPTPRPSRMKMPKLGIMPGNYEAIDGGVLVDDVSPGGAAQKAGIKAGDIIVEIAGKPVKNIGGYMTTMAQQKAGKAIPVVVMRKDDKVTVDVTPTP